MIQVMAAKSFKHPLHRQRMVWAYCVICCVALARAAHSYAEDPPLKNQPERFNGAVGRRFKVQTQVDLTKVRVGEPLRLLVVLTTDDPDARGVRRPNLRNDAWFTKRFYIEDIPDRDRVVKTVKGTLWEFHYRLKPLDVTVDKVPIFRFAYYKPGSVPPELGYRWAFADAISLKVLPRRRAKLVDASGKPIQPPPQFYEVPSSEAILRRVQPDKFPPFGLLIVGATAPLLLTGVFVLFWRQRHPDELKRRRLRRSQAARLALKKLSRKIPADPSEAARQSSEALLFYLAQRADYSLKTPAPDEIQRLCTSIGVSTPVAQRLSVFLTRCDEVRFAGAAIPAGNLRSEGEQLINALEMELCHLPPRYSQG
ncbi:MAG: hypothetical protein KatS3mg105_4544 [Gemmatales bacterium]|nr:MAG: hypothetical protein KatS3mg105_4544 [Gemmatales bacterium]